MLADLQAGFVFSSIQEFLLALGTMLQTICNGYFVAQQMWDPKKDEGYFIST